MNVKRFEVLELAQATTQKNPQELQNAFDSIKKRLKGLRDDIQSSPALKSLKETQVSWLTNQ